MFYTRQDGYLRFPIQVTVVGMFLLVTSLTAAVAIGLQYYFSTKLATESTLKLYRQAAESTSDLLALAERQAVDATRMLVTYPGLVRAGKLSSYTRELFAQTL